MRKIEMIGKKFGRLTVLNRAEKKGRRLAYNCACECGNIRIVVGECLRSGNTKSCGCLNTEVNIKRFLTHGMRRTREYRTWAHMLERCRNTNNAAYDDYGGRGITVCEKWLKFENFFADMEKRPENTSIERIDNDKGYYKENCIWASKTMQVRNRRIFKTNKTGTPGIYWLKKKQKYHVEITAGKTIFLGLFSDLEKAKEARLKGETTYWKKTEGL